MAPSVLDLVAKAGAILVEEGATEVYLFGSAAEGRVREESDLDLAVRGLPAARYFRAVGRLLRELPCPVDVINLDGDTPFARRLLERGRLRRVA